MRLVALVLMTAVLATGAADADRPAAGSRRATTIAALVAYPVFFHTQPVRVRGTIANQGRGQVLRSGEIAVAVAGPGIAGAALDADTLVEITGTFVDVGRLEAGDPRLAGVDIATVWTDANRSWPGVGELPLLVADRAAAAEPFTAPSVRALALEPWKYADQRVTVTGRFHGLNLYGELPDAPRQRWAFVLQSADSAIWVVGVRPKGEGFNLDVNARVDTGRWLEVSGVVKFERALPVVEGQLVNEGKPPAEAPPSEPAARVPAIGPDPEVVFSLPTQDETDVPATTNVRIQFSRALDPRSLAGQVRVSYLGSQSKERGEPQPPSIAFQSRYDQSANVLEIRFAEPLERFRTLRIELGDGIHAVDGAPLRLWSLTFTVGG